MINFCEHLNRISIKMEKYWLFSGIICVMLFYLPYFILGEQAFYRTHDFLEQDFVHTALAAKYLELPFQTTAEEILGGVPIASIQPHSFLQVLLYKLFPGITFLLINQVLLSVLGFLGFFLLADYLLPAKQFFLKYGLSVLYGLIPCLMHGATVLGAPLFLYVLLRVKAGEWQWGGVLFYFFFGLGTSLVAGGFGYFAIFFFSLLHSLKKRNHVGSIVIKAQLLSILALAMGYIINFRYSIFGSDFISHRISWDLMAYHRNLVNVFGGCFVRGNGEYPIFHMCMAGVFLAALTVYLYLKIRHRKYENACSKVIIFLLGMILTVDVFCALYTGAECVLEWRSMLGTLGKIQFNRISYFLPILWMLLFLYTASWLLEKSNDLPRQVSKGIIFLICGTLLLQALLLVRSHSGYANNIRALAGQSRRGESLTYGEFFDDTLWKNVREAIGKPQEEYKIACLGINPGIAIYEGFYCLDGYSTNYPLQYKMTWRKVIDSELSKNDAHRVYYDNWGSRCYLVSHELPFRSEFIPAGQSINLDIDINTFRELGGEYIFSAVEIANFANLHLELLVQLYSEDKERCVYVYHVVE